MIPYHVMAMPVPVFLFLSAVCLAVAFAAWLNAPKRHRRVLTMAMLLLIGVMAKSAWADQPVGDPCAICTEWWCVVIGCW